MLNKKNKGMRRRFRRALAKLQTNSLLIWRSRSGAISIQGQRTPSTAPWVSPHMLDQRSRVYRGQEHHARVCDGEADEDVDRFDELLAWFDAWTGGVDDPEFVTRLIEWNALIDAM